MLGSIRAVIDAVISTGAVVLVVLSISACSGRAKETGSEERLPRECETYVSSMIACQERLAARKLPHERVAELRQSFAAQAKDDAARTSLASTCEEGMKQIAITCP